MDGFGEALAQISPLIGGFMMIALIAVLGFLLVILMRRRTSRGTARTSTMPRIGSVDAYALILDPESREFHISSLVKIHENLYISYSSPPKFLVPVSPSFKPSNIDLKRRRYCIDVTKPFFIAVSQQYVIDPLEPSYLKEATLADSSIKIQSESVKKLLEEFITKQEQVMGSVVVTPRIEMLFTISIPRFVSKSINEILIKASQALASIFANLAEWDRLTKYMDALSRYSETRMRWIIYLGIAMMLSFIGLAVVLMLGHR